MRAVIQRVAKASVSIEKKVVGKIGLGYVILLGVGNGDSEMDVNILAEKIVQLRVMSDENGKMNKSLLDVYGEVLVVSQFTLYADCTKGRRPSFTKAAKPDLAKKLYEMFINELASLGVKKVERGEFGAYMTVEIINNGPVTIILDTKEQ